MLSSSVSSQLQSEMQVKFYQVCKQPNSVYETTCASLFLTTLFLPSPFLALATYYTLKGLDPPKKSQAQILLCQKATRPGHRTGLKIASHQVCGSRASEIAASHVSFSKPRIQDTAGYPSGEAGLLHVCQFGVPAD